MNTTKNTRFRPIGLILGVGVGAALTASNGLAVGSAVGIAVAVVFGFLGRRTGCGE